MNKKLQVIAEKLKKEHFERSGSIYHPIPFPEFADVTTSTNVRSPFTKWKQIVSALPSKIVWSSVRVLDVGANAGFYSFQFAKTGAKVEAYEPHEHYVRYGREITGAAHLDITWYNKKLDGEDIQGKYDIAVMLSVFQWMSEGNKYLDEATRLLDKIIKSSRYVFFELGCNHGTSAIRVEGSQLAWLYKFLNQSAGAKGVFWLGKVEAWGGGIKRHTFAITNEKIELTWQQRLVTKYLQLRYRR